MSETAEEKLLALAHVFAEDHIELEKDVQKITAILKALIEGLGAVPFSDPKFAGFIGAAKGEAEDINASIDDRLGRLRERLSALI